MTSWDRGCSNGPREAAWMASDAPCKNAQPLRPAGPSGVQRWAPLTSPSPHRRSAVCYGFFNDARYSTKFTRSSWVNA